MDLEKDYIEYVGEFSLALLAASAAYFFNFQEPISYATLLMVPLLFGYTAFISREGFRSSSLLGFIAFMFVPLGGTHALLSIVIGVGNFLVSVFGGGKRFRDFYSTTTLPLLLTGIILGAGLFLAATSQPDLGDRIRNDTAELVGEKIGGTVEKQVMGDLRQRQISLMEQTSRSTVKRTRVHVLNQTEGLDTRERQKLVESFRSAEKEIPREVSSRVEERMSGATSGVSEKISQLVRSNLRGEAMLLLIPMAAFGLYTLQPLIGLLTAISAFLFLKARS